jgi:rhodanese-related sulfurtransferase/DNA-directed RNA polymerase subunit RPC12/RpoP
MKNIFLFALFVAVTGFGFEQQHLNGKINEAYADTQYVCLPCGSDCDKTVYTKPGTCSHCMMPLVNKATVKFKTVAPAALCSFIKNKGKDNVVLLDVRTAEEFNGTAPDKFGKLAGAINIPVQELDKRMAELNPYKNKEIVVYCSHSRRSPRASYMLMQKGFTKVTNMELGMSEWTNTTQPGDCNNKLYVKQ